MIDSGVGILCAPMAGGPSTPDLANAVIAAGGGGSLGFGYLAAEAAEAQLRAVTGGPLLVNLFYLTESTGADTAPYVARLRAAGLDVDEPRWENDAFADKLDIVCAVPPAAVSFTFGCPPPDVLARVQRAGSQAWVTVTSVDEARAAAAAGADALVVQGSEAGGHRGAWVDGEAGAAGGRGAADAHGAEPVGLLALLQVVRAAVDVPLVATGGIATAAGVTAVLDAGAALAAAGTAFMLAPEAGTPAPLRAAIATERPTALTRAFTGRLARGIVNDFMREHDAYAPSAYPEIHHVTAGLRKRARAAGDESVVNLWAGQAHALTVDRPAADTVAALTP